MKNTPAALSILVRATMALLLALSFSLFLFSGGQETDDSHAALRGRRFLAEGHTSADGEKDEVEEEEEEEEEQQLNTGVILCIVLFLIFTTIAFELIKDHIEEHVHKNFKPIIEKLFGEMTILGFLSLVTFCITQAGYFEILSEKFYHDPEELLEIFEFIHFCIFFIMVFFVLQVLVLVREATEIEEQWLVMDEYCREVSISQRHGITKCRQKSRWATFCQLLLRYDNKQQDKDDRTLFQALRHEFIMDRSTEPPFTPQQSEENRLPYQEFNFGRYLSMNLGLTLSHTVEVSNVTWLFFAFGAVVFAGLHVMLDYNMTELAWTWVGMGWALYFFELFFEWHLIYIRDQMAARKIVASFRQQDTDSKVPATDRTPLTGDGTLPRWTKIDLEEYKNCKRSWIAKYFVGGTPNRQQALYWADRKGPHLYVWILQGKLIFVGLYISVQCLEFIQHVANDVSILHFALYLVLGVLPILGIVFRAKHLVATLSLVSCLGTYRRPQVVASVLREEKIRTAVRSFMCIYKLRRFAVNAGNTKPAAQHGTRSRGGRPPMHFSDSFSQLVQSQVGKTFESLDLDGSGSISVEEIQQLMMSLGVPMMPSTLATIVQDLDADGDNEISRDEFLQWYANSMMEEDDLTDAERAKFLFSMFDPEGSGEITIGEFMNKLHSLNAGFTVEEIGYICNAVDEDDSGTIGLDEFVHLIEENYPQELRIKRGISSPKISEKPPPSAA